MRLAPLIVLLVPLLLAACVDRNQAALHPTADGIEARMFVVTNRADLSDGMPGDDRRGANRYLDVGVSVPRDRPEGSLRVSDGVADPARDFLLKDMHDLPGRAGFRQALRRALATRAAPDREVVIYVHGYNNAFSDGVFRMAQIQRDMALDAVTVQFSWPSAAHPLGYAHDRESMLYSRDALEETLRDIGTVGARNVVLVGHSMGAMLVMETLRQMDIATPGASARLLGGVILIAPDIDVDVFHDQARRIDPLPQPFAIFSSRKDAALRLSSRVNRDSQRLGTLESAAPLSDLPITLLDVTGFATGPLRDSHFTVATSPALIQLLRRSPALEQSFRRGPGVTGPLSTAVVTVQRATELILSPDLLDGL